MTDRDLVLDAVALSALLDERKPDHADARRVLAAWAAESAPDAGDAAVPPFVVPTIVLYEVRRGLLKVGARRRLRDLDRFIRTYAWIEEFDQETASIAAELWADRARAGQPAGERDLLVLATAKLLDCDVITRDAGFPSVKGVRVLTWAQVAAELVNARAELNKG